MQVNLKGRNFTLEIEKDFEEDPTIEIVDRIVIKSDKGEELGFLAFESENENTPIYVEFHPNRKYCFPSSLPGQFSNILEINN